MPEKPEIPEFAQKYIAKVEASWNHAFTDPLEYDPNNFCYLVHTISTGDDVFGDMAQDMMAAMYKKQIPPEQRVRNVDLSLKPDKIGEKQLISCSIIANRPNYDKPKIATFKDVGLILKADFDNVVAISQYDIASPFFAKIDQSDPRGWYINQYKERQRFKALTTIGRGWQATGGLGISSNPLMTITNPENPDETYTTTKLMPVEEMLDGTHYLTMNETVLAGTGPKGLSPKIKAIGYFSNDFNGYNFKKAKRMSEKLEVPLIIITHRSITNSRNPQNPSPSE